ncbi:MAG: hypothetical protein SLAVMIC_00117 [uncultured marine phage]|uniref:Uncharacterized protein n=1 Tax=uncultured marine phage TaxID=707152 RepID=A0A8D9FQT4_9VIRU|nr:MAG: hypothetical protein SLAVMIC_00117 [uncultured marine phage]
MPLHSKDTFIRPVSVGDTQIFIQDVNLKVSFEINPWRVTATYHQSCYIVVKLQGTDNPLKIKFRTEREALEALTIFQGALDLLKSETSDIPKEIIDYIDIRILQLINDSHFAFRQELASDTWLVGPHTMDKKGAITITNDDLEVIIGYAKYIDNENVLVKFNQPLTGWVFLN